MELRAALHDLRKACERYVLQLHGHRLHVGLTSAVGFRVERQLHRTCLHHLLLKESLPLCRKRGGHLSPMRVHSRKRPLLLRLQELLLESERVLVVDDCLR